jgi:signal peptidase II
MGKVIFMKRRVFIFSGIVALVDQLVKLLVVSTLKTSGSIVVIQDFLNLTYVENDGAAWGIFSGNRWFLIIISIIAIYAVIKYFLLDVNVTKIEFTGYSLLLGGIIGNLIDRIFNGYIVDFIEFIFGNYHFPVFNIADMAIVIGVVMVIIYLMINAIKQRRKK